jgi:poly(3-hydroxyoctanoate) depolymerase
MSGHGEFWAPVADLLTVDGHRCTLIDWPGLGGNPVDPQVNSYDDLVDLVASNLVASNLDGPTVLVAQSMGGYVALRVALDERSSPLISHVVLAVTSGGVDLASLGAIDWRPSSRAAHPDAPPWAFAPTIDLASRLGEITVPCLLLWATDDETSPVAVGRHLNGLLPDSRLVTYDCDDHWVARIHSSEVAAEISAFLS